jgi:heme-degrading monooxygenase HmoA
VNDKYRPFSRWETNADFVHWQATEERRLIEMQKSTPPVVCLPLMTKPAREVEGPNPLDGTRLWDNS